MYLTQIEQLQALKSEISLIKITTNDETTKAYLESSLKYLHYAIIQLTIANNIEVDKLDH